MKQYDYLIVGAGIFGAVFAYHAGLQGKSCLVIDKRKHIGGNAYTEECEGIRIHIYGAHIFHTSDKKIWDFMNRFAVFNHYVNSPLLYSHGKLFNLPFNMNTFYRLWGLATPAEVQRKIEEERAPYRHLKPQNLEEQALYFAGKEFYEVFIKEYTEKQWGRKATELPPWIIQRLPLRFTYNNNYFNDTFQGIPIGGYTAIIKQLLSKATVWTDTDFIRNRNELLSKVCIVIYTGRIDEYYDYCYGELEFRSLRFEHETLPIDNYQGNAVINYADKEIPYTRIIEHKHFEFSSLPKTIITKEYPQPWKSNSEPLYPVNTERNDCIYQQYKNRSSMEKNIYFGGRLGYYQYADMDKTIYEAMILHEKIEHTFNVNTNSDCQTTVR